MKISKKGWMISSVITLIPLFVGLMIWKDLPDTMAVHWGFDGQANGFASKGFAVFGLPLFMLLIHGITVMASVGKARKVASEKVTQLLLMICPAVSLFCGGMIYMAALNVSFSIARVVMVFVGVLWAVIGNYLPKVRQNPIYGIRLPWTMKSEENWNHTHRVAGPIWVIGGLTLATLGLIGKGMEACIVMILLAILVPCVYSYGYAQKEKQV